MNEFQTFLSLPSFFLTLHSSISTLFHIFLSRYLAKVAPASNFLHLPYQELYFVYSL